MGKAARSKRHDEKMRLRRAAKAMRKASYQAMAGTSQKAKKQKVSVKFNPQKHRHVVARCGNTGCARCFPDLNQIWGAGNRETYTFLLAHGRQWTADQWRKTANKEANAS